MSARIHKSFEFLSALHFNHKYHLNQYILDANFIVETSSIEDQNIAMDRIKFFLHECLQNSIFINQIDTVAMDKYVNAGINICTLPEDPYDQIVGIMLLSKLNSITEGRLTLTDLSIESSMSDGVGCYHSVDESMGPFYEKGWWNDSSQSINNLHTRNTKIVKLNNTKNDWADVYLDWEEKSIYKNTEIVFASFDKTDK